MMNSLHKFVYLLSGKVDTPQLYLIYPGDCSALVHKATILKPVNTCHMMVQNDHLNDPVQMQKQPRVVPKLPGSSRNICLLNKLNVSLAVLCVLV